MPDQTLSGTQVRKSIQRWFTESFGRCPDIHVNESARFRPVDVAEAQAILDREARCAPALHREEHYDCGDFGISARSAIAFASIDMGADKEAPRPAFGIIFAGLHCTNIGIGTDGRPYLYDTIYDKQLKAPASLEHFLEDLIGTGWLNPDNIRYVFV